MTYQAFFKLNDTPFRLTPDVDYFFGSQGHSAALETLLYSIRSGEGFVQITGHPGVGKTILVRHLLNQLGEKVNTALILHPRLNAEDLLKAILEDLGVPSDVIQNNTKEGLLRFFRKHLVETSRAGCTTVIIVDEAQEIPDDTLEELRLLSNLETEKNKLLSIILVGQTELEEKLNRNSLRQLHQRITIRYRIEPFTRKETAAYILHRLSLAGASGNIHFSESRLNEIHRLSQGIPRRINIICERALMAACVEGVHNIKNSHLKRALESYLGTVPGLKRRRFELKAVVVLLVAFLFGGWWWAFSSGYRFTVTANGQMAHSLGDAPSPKAVLDGMAANKDHLGATDSLQPSLFNKKPSASKTVTPKRTAPLPIDMLPKNWRCLIVNRLEGQGQVWQGDGTSLTKAASFDLQGATLEDGVYLLGMGTDNRPFLFNHHHFTPWDQYQELSSRLWMQFGADSDLAVIPLIVWSGKEENWSDSFHENVDQIRVLVKGWATAWRSLDLDTFIRYYGSTHLSYTSMQSKPAVISREHYYQRIGRIFQKSKGIVLQISEPVCVVNPADPQTAMVIFMQRYTSSRYVDEGIKVLFLRRLKEDGDTDVTWKIEGHCWMGSPSVAEGKDAL